jgi:hypothetical protein
MRFHFKAISMHPYWVADAVLAVHIEAALDDMDDLAVVRYRDRTRLLKTGRLEAFRCK